MPLRPQQQLLSSFPPVTVKFDLQT